MWMSFDSLHGDKAKEGPKSNGRDYALDWIRKYRTCQKPSLSDWKQYFGAGCGILKMYEYVKQDTGLMTELRRMADEVDREHREMGDVFLEYLKKFDAKRSETRNNIW